MPRITPTPAEEILIESQVIIRPSLQRRELLGCLACRWNHSIEQTGSARAYGKELIECTGLPGPLVYQTMRKLEEAGVVTVATDPTISTNDQRSLRRRYIQPAETEIGVFLQAALETPMQCDLKMPATNK